MTIGEIVRKLLFGETPEKYDEDARSEWREAIHENKNETQKSVAEARKSRKASDEATRVAEWAVKILEGKQQKLDGEGKSRPRQKAHPC